MKNYPKKTIGELCNIVKGETGIASAIAGLKLMRQRLNAIFFIG